MNWDIEADVVVVGAGGAGLTAAGTVASLNKSARIVLLEKDFETPCNTAIASNFIPAAGTRFQRAAGIDDSPVALVADITVKNGGKSDPDVTRAISEQSGPAIHWLVDALGINLELAPELTWLGHSAVRMHAHPTRGGPAMLADLRVFAERSARIEVLDKVSVNDLVRDGSGAVTGVVAKRGPERLRVGARKVVLTTGGYNANPAMLARYIPEMADAPNIGAKTDSGDGILWGVKAGGQAALMSAYQGRDCISADGTRVTPPVLNEGGIAVNASGRRFVNEREDYSALARVYRAQPGKVAFFLWDARIQEMVKDVFIMRQAMERGGIIASATLDEVAAGYALPGDALRETVERYNAGVRDRADEFGRTGLTVPLEPPYFASRITGAVAHTQGGLVVDSYCRVIKDGGTPVPNLYAGGNTMAGLSGDGPGGYLSGNGLLVAYTSGFIIGQHVAQSVPANH